MFFWSEWFHGVNVRIILLFMYAVKDSHYGVKDYPTIFLAPLTIKKKFILEYFNLPFKQILS